VVANQNIQFTEGNLARTTTAPIITVVAHQLVKTTWTNRLHRNRSSISDQEKRRYTRKITTILKNIKLSIDLVGEEEVNSRIKLDTAESASGVKMNMNMAQITIIHKIRFRDQMVDL